MPNQKETTGSVLVCRALKSLTSTALKQHWICGKLAFYHYQCLNENKIV